MSSTPAASRAATSISSARGDGCSTSTAEGYDVRWSARRRGSVTTWTYADSGNPVILPPGKVWWEIVPVGSAITED